MKRVRPSSKIDRWFKAAKLSLIAIPIEAALLILAGLMPNNSAFILAFTLPFIPAGALLSRLFPGPSHNLGLLVVMIAMSFGTIVVCVWLVLTAIEALSQRGNRQP